MDLGIRTETFQPSEDQSWLGSAHATDTADSVTLLVSAFSAFEDGFIPSGVVLAKVAATGLYVPYVKGGAGGAGTAVGFLFTTKKVGPGQTHIPAAAIWHGQVVIANLPTGHGLNVTAAGQLGQFNLVGTVPADPA